MTAQTFGWTGGRRRVLAALLALAILIPLCVLFLDHHRHQSASRSLATQERHGIEYLLALGQLTIALTGAQSAAVSGEPVSPEVLTAAVADVTEVDDRLGEQLRVGERWSQLRDAIERATGTDHPDGRAAVAAYEEATSLLLGLHDRLRETTGLIRDPDPDAHHLQNAAGGSLPEAIVATGKLADLVIIAAGEPAREQAGNGPEISVAVDAVNGSIEQFVAGIQAALDSTRSRNLSSSVLSKYDRFLRAKDGLLLVTTPPDGGAGSIDLGQLAFVRAELQDAADDLSTTLLTELDTLIQNRLGELNRSRWTAIVALSVGVLLAFGLVAVSLVRTPRQPTRHRHQNELTAGSGDDTAGARSGPGRGTPQLARPLTPISGSAAGYEPEPATRPASDRLAGELLDSEHADVR